MVGDLASHVKFEEFEIESDMVPVTVDVSGQLSYTRILLSPRRCMLIAFITSVRVGIFMLMSNAHACAVPLRLDRAHPDGQWQDYWKVRDRGLLRALHRQSTHLCNDRDAEQEREQTDKARHTNNKLVSRLYFLYLFSLLPFLLFFTS